MVVQEEAPEYLKSGSALIKALKTPSDPPQSHWPTKIEIALLASSKEDVYLPRKAEVLRDWVLETLLRPQKLSSSSVLNPHLDGRYFDLLLQTWRHSPSSSAVPLNLLVHLFNSLSSPSTTIEQDLIPKACEAFKLCFRSVQQIRPEAWLEVWRACLEALSSRPWNMKGNLESWEELISLIVKIWDPERGGSLNDTRKALTLVYGTLPNLIRARHLNSSLKTLDDSFSPIYLPASSLKSNNALEGLLTEMSNISSEDEGCCATEFLPFLLHHYIAQMSRYRYQIFTTASSSNFPLETFISNKLNEGVIRGVKGLFDILKNMKGLSEFDVLLSKRRMWEEIAAWGGYLENDEDWRKLLEDSSEMVKTALKATTDNAIREQALAMLDILENLDHANADISQEVVAWCCAAPVRLRPAAEKLLLSLLRYNELTYHMDSFLSIIDTGLGDLFLDDLDDDSARRLYELVSAGPMYSQSMHRAVIRAQLIGSNLSGCVHGLRGIVERMRHPTQHTDKVLDKASLQSKRKRERENRASSAALTALRCQIACMVTRHLSILNLDAIGILRGFFDLCSELEEESGTSVLDSTPRSEKKAKKKAKPMPTHQSYWSQDSLLAAKLDILRILDRATKDDASKPAYERNVDSLLTRLRSTDALAEVQIAILRFLSQRLALALSRGAQRSDHAWTGSFLDVWLDLLEIQSNTTQTTESLAASAWQLLAEEGIFVFASYGQQEQRKNLARLLGLHVDPNSKTSPVSRSAQSILSASDTWELPNLRTALIDLLSAAFSTTSETLDLTMLDLLSATPISALPRSQLQSVTHSLCIGFDAGLDDRTCIKILHWLSRLAGGPDTIHFIDFTVVKKLFMRVWSPDLDHKETAVILDFAQTLFVHLVRRVQDHGDIMDEIIDLCLGQTFSSIAENRLSVNDELALLWLEELTSGKASTSPSQMHQKKLKTLAKKLANRLQPVLQAMSGVGSSIKSEGLIRAWLSVLRLHRVIGLKPPSMSLSRNILPRILATTDFPMKEGDSSVPLLELIYEEKSRGYDETILATYTLLHSWMPSDGSEETMKRIMTEVSLDHFAQAAMATCSAIQSLIDAMDDDAEDKMLIAHLHTLQTLLSIGREGSGKVVRRICASLLDSLARITEHGQLSTILSALRCLESLVTLRSRILNPDDLFIIYEILLSLLMPRLDFKGTSSSETRQEFFDRIISILSSLVRQRADLVVEAVPELVGTLCGFMPLFLRPRPAFRSSNKGRARVFSRWPNWMVEYNSTSSAQTADPEQSSSLGAAQAAQLSRLIVTLTHARLEVTATKPRPASISNSLVKHVPAVLVHYCRAVADPWGSISREIRKELEPGLASLMEIMTAGGRVHARGREGEGIGIPFGLGEAGEVEKEVWADMWLRWAKTRYVGKG